MLAYGLREHLREYRDDFVFWQRRRAQRPSLPRLQERDRPLVESLLRDGACVTSLAALGVADTDRMLAAADRLFAKTEGRAPVKGGYCSPATTAEIEAHPELIRWGLDERLLSIVGHYLGLRVSYRGLTVRRDLKGGDMLETRLWHRDAEDKRILKIIVYCNDVDRGGGAFEFVPRQAGPPTWRAATPVGRLTDQQMTALVPPSAWRPCSGPRGTVVIADTCSVYHRGQIAEAEDRLALFFCYNSDAPLDPASCTPLFDTGAFVARESLSLAQKAAIGC
jgi:hypothetical protein